MVIVAPEMRASFTPFFTKATRTVPIQWRGAKSAAVPALPAARAITATCGVPLWGFVRRDVTCPATRVAQAFATPTPARVALDAMRREEPATPILCATLRRACVSSAAMSVTQAAPAEKPVTQALGSANREFVPSASRRI